jgi:hypothetical protein
MLTLKQTPTKTETPLFPLPDEFTESEALVMSKRE